MAGGTRYATGMVVKDEGVQVIANPQAIDFVGGGVTVTEDPTGVAKVTIPGASYVDIPICFTVGGSFGSQTTNYCGIGNTLATTEAAVPYNPIGVTGTVVGLYIQEKTNTHNANHVITMQSGAADAASLTPSDIVITFAPSALNGSDVAHTLSVTPTTLVGFKFYSASGSGSSTSIAVTIVVRVTVA